jgi:5-methylcytosine-specific restriction endonuclease McrA
MTFEGIAEPDISKLTGIRRTGAGSHATYKRLLSKDPCSYCGCPSRFMTYGCNVDHIEPRAEGGANHWTNYTAACAYCNALKTNLPLWLFLVARLCELRYLEEMAGFAP